MFFCFVIDASLIASAGLALGRVMTVMLRSTV